MNLDVRQAGLLHQHGDGGSLFNAEFETDAAAGFEPAGHGGKDCAIGIKAVAAGCQRDVGVIAANVCRQPGHVSFGNVGWV